MASASNTANKNELPDQAVVDEPSMEEILASIKQIIADDETPDDGLTERERYSHPDEHSNENVVVEDGADEVEAGLQAAMEAEMRSVVEQPVVQEVAPVSEAPVASAHEEVTAPEVSVEERAAKIRADLSATSEGLSTDERLEQYRAQGKLRMEALAEKATKAAPVAATVAGASAFVSNPQVAAPSAPQPAMAAPFVASAPAQPTSTDVANEVATMMIRDKSAEIEALLSDIMRPTIRQWLTDNLPSLVEKLVREEIERVSQGKKAS